jgi:large repetitive protein
MVRAIAPGRMHRYRREDTTMVRLVLALAVLTLLTLAPHASAGGISDEECPNIAGENTNTCPAGTVGVPYSIRFTEKEGSGCGPGRQTFHFDSGILPPGLTLALDGTLSGTSFQPGTFKFYVEMREPTDDPAHCAGKETQKQFTLKIRRQPWIISSPALTPRSEVGVPFRIALRARGGSGVFAWSLASGRLPAGLRLFADGSVEGIPRSSGTPRFTVRATDAEGRTVGWKVEFAIAPKLRVQGRRQLPRAHTGRSYRTDLVSVGGVGPTTWRLTRGRLPRGLRLESARGRLTGSPTEAGTHAFTVEVRDGLKAKDRGTVRIVVGRMRRDSQE